MEYDCAFEMAASNIRFGPGTTAEVGMDLADLYSSYPPEDFLDYVNRPIGKGLPVPDLRMPAR